MSHVNHSVKPCPLIGPFEPDGPNVNSHSYFQANPMSHVNHSVKPCPLIGPFEPDGPNVNSPI